MNKDNNNKKKKKRKNRKNFGDGKTFGDLQWRSRVSVETSIGS
jgi:hypothetical protein